MSDKKKNIGKILGIDLGTTNSVVTVYDGDKKEYIPIPSLTGNPLIPSVFYIKNSKAYVGDKAKAHVKEDPENVIASVKSMIDNPKHRYVIAEAVQRPDGSTREAEFSPIEISSHILAYIKKCAEEYIGSSIKDVVITVPAYFKEIERKATTRAAEKVGLNLVEIINEPTSACLAYGYANSKEDEEKNILVYDLGGGTFDVTYLNMTPDVYEVKATDGMKIGGDDIDQAFLEYIKGRMNIGKATDKQAKLVAEEAKKVLSSENEVEVDFTNYGGEKEVFTRKQFEGAITRIVHKTITKVINILDTQEEEVDEVVLVGGSTRIPLIRKDLSKILGLSEDYFDKYKVDPDLAVSIGACVRGRILLGDTDILLIDRTPFDLGVELDDGMLDPIIQRGSIVPTMGHQTYQTTDSKVNKVEFRVYQGNNPIASDNQYLGKIEFDIDTTLAQTISYKVSFGLDESGVLSVEVLNLLSRERKHVEVTGVVD